MYKINNIVRYQRTKLTNIKVYNINLITDVTDFSLPLSEKMGFRGLILKKKEDVMGEIREPVGASVNFIILIYFIWAHSA